MIHEGIGNQSAIARVAMWGVQRALNAGWKVSVVANVLEKSLQADVEWLRLSVPRRGFLLKWITARHFIRSALGRRLFDVVHAHQPQAAALSDVFTCHFLTRVAHERHCLESRRGFYPALVRAQQRGVMHAEDYFYRRWNPHTRMVFCSYLLQEEFKRLYPAPERFEVLENACPPMNIPKEEARHKARAQLLRREWKGPVLGYLGGLHERKGYPALLKAMQNEPDIFLLMGGEFTQGFEAPELNGRFKALGWLSDPSEFFAACDVFIVPSVFDPCPLAVLDAAAHGLPVIATAGVGNLPTLLKYGAGAAWEPGTPLGPLVRSLVAQRERCQNGARQMSELLAEERQSARLLRIYEETRQEKQCGSHST